MNGARDVNQDGNSDSFGRSRGIGRTHHSGGNLLRPSNHHSFYNELAARVADNLTGDADKRGTPLSFVCVLGIWVVFDYVAPSLLSIPKLSTVDDSEHGPRFYESEHPTVDREKHGVDNDVQKHSTLDVQHEHRRHFDI